ncbi:tudor domain-containing 6-like [Bradysia coprophila]|uniref:tudor domain-containing 6-like n=1 Tax=Bradysia coprophila TaxID=38358 RepID=UPI00187DC50E|nr:tudor domain-containing 6-like [Bradysia coprophila]
MANRSGDKELQRNGHTNECFVCKKSCENTCSRCGEFYCSKQCQTVDWREHKYYCFEMPELIIKSSPANGHHFNNSPKFQSENRRVLQNLRRGDFRPEHSNQSENTTAVESQQSQRTHAKRDEESAPTAQPVVFNFGDYPKNNDDVVITHVRHANSFYIRTCCTDNQYQKNAKDFDDYGRRGVKLTSIPQRNDAVLVRHDGKFHRAIVLQVEGEDNVEIALADTGRKIHKPVHDMRQITDELKSRERYNFIVTLTHMPKKLNPAEFRKLREFVNNQTVFKVQFDGDDWKSAQKFKLLMNDSGLPMEAFVLGNEPSQFNGNDSKDDKNTKPVKTDSGLVETSIRDEPNNGPAALETTSIATNVEEPMHSPNTPGTEEVNKSNQPILFKHLATETLPDVAGLMIFDNSSVHLGYVSAVATKSIENLYVLHNKVNEYGSLIHEVYEPELDELCLVKFEDEWYRAIKCETKFWFIDWGNMEDIDSCNIRRFPEDLKDPCHTFVCHVHGLTSEMALDEGKIEQLKVLLENQSQHPDCVCVKVEHELMEYNVKFPILSNFF